jgi:hypothetical protein
MLRIQIFWHVTLCHLVSDKMGCLTIEDEYMSIKFIRNGENHSPNNKALHPRGPEFGVSLATVLPDVPSSKYTLFRKSVWHNTVILCQDTTNEI